MNVYMMVTLYSLKTLHNYVPKIVLIRFQPPLLDRLDELIHAKIEFDLSSSKTVNIG